MAPTDSVFRRGGHKYSSIPSHSPQHITMSDSTPAPDQEASPPQPQAAVDPNQPPLPLNPEQWALMVDQASKQGFPGAMPFQMASFVSGAPLIPRWLPPRPRWQAL